MPTVTNLADLTHRNVTNNGIEMSRQKRNEDLKVGDVMDLWCGAKRITQIRPYTGPLSDIIFAIAEYTPGGGTARTGGISLERGGYTDVIS